MRVAYSWDPSQPKYIRKILVHKHVQNHMASRDKYEHFSFIEIVKKLTYVLLNIGKIPLVPNLGSN